MQVSNLMAIDAKFDSAKAVRKSFHVRPTHHFMFYQLGNAAHDALLIIDHCLLYLNVGISNENKPDLKSISFRQGGVCRKDNGIESKDIHHFSNK